MSDLADPFDFLVECRSHRGNSIISLWFFLKRWAQTHKTSARWPTPCGGFGGTATTRVDLGQFEAFARARAERRGAIVLYACASGRPPTRVRLLDAAHPIAVSKVAATLPARAWRRVSWQNEQQPTRWRADFIALRVTPAHDWRKGHLSPEVWLLLQRPVGSAKVAKYFFIHLPAATALKRLVWIAHQRWAIEQQYQQLKDELGLDHFEGRTYPGWNRHVVLTAVAYTFLQQERRTPRHAADVSRGARTRLRSLHRAVLRGASEAVGLHHSAPPPSTAADLTK